MIHTADEPHEIVATVHNHVGREQFEGNRALFLAAPDLLAACKAAYAHFSWLMRNGSLTKEEEPFLEVMRAAVAKAKGEPHEQPPD